MCIRDRPWAQVRARVLGAAPGAQTVAGTFPAIQEALAILDDGHSSFTYTDGRRVALAGRTCTGPVASDPVGLPVNVGYLRVRAFAGADAAATVHAAAIQDAIRAADREGLAGWIVDLRGNAGGNLWPMLAGLGPILGDGVLGHFVDPDGGEVPWVYRDGAISLGEVVQERVATPYRLRRPMPRVAVLTDARVASSAEGLAIAFRGRPGTRTFGVATCGLSTVNQPFSMNDGSTLSLAVAIMADRARRAFGDRVPPDEIVEGADEVVARAVSWLQRGE